MKKIVLFIGILLFSTGVMSVAATIDQGLLSPLTSAYEEISRLFVGEYQGWGEQFVKLQSTLFSRMFLAVIVGVPLVFLLHYLVIGPMVFSHEGEQIHYFNLLSRGVHLFAAVSFTLLAITGLLVIFGSFFGGGALIRTCRTIHLAAAVVFSLSALAMLFIWAKDMILAPYDFLWILIAGGYLSKEQKPVPAGKFNFGQKSWFWLATLGGATMAVTGYFLYSFQADTETLRLFVMIHNFLGAVMVAVFIVHLYMSLFAIKGAIRSMISGYKPEAEVRILHSRYLKE
ncbi:MAG: formate dehydrogenase subunit gamma [Thermodesulfobacteriota bacterium]